MSVTYINAELRRLVWTRAEGICEYCLRSEIDSLIGFQIDHVIGEKHGGLTDAANLAYVCAFCNRAKGSDVGSVHWESRQFLRFFNPRLDRWYEHFVLQGLRIEPRTPIGVVTAAILGFNAPKRLRERAAMIASNSYPSPAALIHMLPG